ncbi:ATP-binding protein [Mameliella alba]|nr:ATP-binding protein [Mameliella alba]MBY6170089.1 ATP-binding protein [Mameliella alba]MBY6174934.1 ATP-binding protein [Mameliella alba]
MGEPTPTLHMVCGKIAAGKSTLAARLATADRVVLIVEDDWLHKLFAEELATPRDYLRCTAKLRSAIGPHVRELLNAGLSVVLDFAANTVEQRRWMKGLLEGTEAAHQMHVLVPSDETCLMRLRARNAAGTHPFSVTEEQFYQFSSHFVRPTADEGFDLVVYDTAT